MFDAPPGRSTRQALHSDTAYTKGLAPLVTCFIALQVGICTAVDGKNLLSPLSPLSRLASRFSSISFISLRLLSGSGLATCVIAAELSSARLSSTPAHRRLSAIHVCLPSAIQLYQTAGRRAPTAPRRAVAPRAPPKKRLNHMKRLSALLWPQDVEPNMGPTIMVPPFLCGATAPGTVFGQPGRPSTVHLLTFFLRILGTYNLFSDRRMEVATVVHAVIPL